MNKNRINFKAITVRINPTLLMFDPIQFPYNLIKTAQASALFFEFYNCNLNWRYLTSLLYLADRKHLIAHGCPITGDTYICIESRPSLLNTNDLIHHRPINDSLEKSRLWQTYFSLPNAKGEINLINHPGNEELSRSMEEAIEQLFEHHATKTLAELEASISNLAECEDRGYPRSIKIYDLLAKNGYNIEDLIAVKNAAEQEQYFAKADSN